ncbi:MAG: FAD-dependent oxidoreductase [Deltaproteobacteria bacterium]|nr:FAD-dependent oxidoreductase [Deltaproteobacteria bacterium]
MTTSACPVCNTIAAIKDPLDAGTVKQPRARRLLDEILSLFEDIAWGMAGEDHLAAIGGLLDELAENCSDPVAGEIKNRIERELSTNDEAFRSHITTQNCPTGDCVKLTPAPCQMACPAGIDVPTYVTLIGMGRDAEAIEVIRRDNPFPWVCGLVCTRPCEFMCVRGRIDKPVSIKFLKAFAAERALSDRQYRNPEKMPDNHKKVCIIGAGPGGMSAAYYLALKGYTVKVIEALPMAGGMTMVGIPRYRLPREVIDREVAMIEELGVEFVFNTRFGDDLSYDDLKKQGFKAFLFAIGAHKAYKLNIPGEDDYPKVIDAIDLLKDVALGHRHAPGKKVVIIGGGNVAIDAARTCLRLGSEEVTIAYRRTRKEMPADEEEVEHAEEEGVKLAMLTIPTEVKGKDGDITALHCLQAKLVKKKGSERMYPTPVEGSDFDIEADAIIPAIGQYVDKGCMQSIDDVGWTRRGTIQVNMANMATTRPDIFAVGDAVTGPATVIEAIGGGKRAANAIDRYLSGLPQLKMPPVPVRRAVVDFIEVPASTKMVLKRPEMPLLNIERRRTTYQQVELGYSENVVREEARRCLRCDVCRRCGECIEVCRDKMKINALQMGYFDFDHPVDTDFRSTQERCITCGACAENCPNNAMRIEDRDGERVLTLCGTVLNRQKLVLCSSCGAVIGPAKYLDYIGKRLKHTADQVGVEETLCTQCARKRGIQAGGIPAHHV